MRGSDTAGYSLSSSAGLEDAVRTNAKNALKPRRRAVGPFISTHITPVPSQTYKSSLSISYRAPSPSPDSDDRSSSPSPPSRRTPSSHTPRSPRLANISTSVTLPSAQRHRHTRSLVTQPSVSPLSLSPSTPLSKLALPPSPLSPPLSTFRFPASPQTQPTTPSSLRRFTTCPISPTSPCRSRTTSEHHHRLLAPETVFISPPRSKPTLAMSIQVHAPIITTPTHSPRVRPSHSSHPSTSSSNYPQSQAQSSPRHSPRPSLAHVQNPTQGPSHSNSHHNSPRPRAASPPPLMLDTPHNNAQIPRPSSRCERLLRDTLRKADEHERAVLFAATASYAYSPNGRRGAYSPKRAMLKRSESYAGAGAGVVDPDDEDGDEDGEERARVEGVLFRPPLGHAHSSTSAHIYRAAAASSSISGSAAQEKRGGLDGETKRGRATERERYPAPGEEYVSVGYGAYAPHGAVLRSQLESVLRAAAASGHGRHGHGREGREGREGRHGHERRESYESVKSAKSRNGGAGAKEGRARSSREREWCWANSPESSSIPSPTAHSSTSTTPSYPSYAALPALSTSATAPLPTSNRPSNSNSNRNSTSTTSTIEPLTPPPTPPHQLARSQSHPQSACSPSSGCSAQSASNSSTGGSHSSTSGSHYSPFNAQSAAKKLRDMPGYVSFANVEGLGNPPGEDDEDSSGAAEGGMGEGGLMRGLWKVLSAGKGRSRSGERRGA